MNKTWKKSAIGLVMANDERYENGVKTIRMNNLVEKPEAQQLIDFGKAYSELTGDQLDCVEVTTVTMVTA